MINSYRLLFSTILSAIILLTFSLAGNTAIAATQQHTNLALTSTAFQNGSVVPTKYTCDGDNVPPPLQWKNTPEKTQSFVIIADDPDAAGGIWIHWIIYNLPSTLTEFNGADPLPPNINIGTNSWNNNFYQGPCPPAGTHHYYFKLYALDTTPKIPPHKKTFNAKDIEAAMQGHILGQGILMGTYSR